MKWITPIFLMLLSVSAQAQLETSNWLFYGSRSTVTPAGVNTAFPPILPTRISTRNTSSISDASGNLLLATDGITIMNADLAVMPALAGVDLGGGAGKVLIHHVSGTTKYLVFYITNNVDNGAINSSWTLRYAIVDLSLQGGKGDVTNYGMVIESKSSPSFALAPGSSSDDAWLVTHLHTTDTFISYHIDGSGLSSTQVVSKAGTDKVLTDYQFFDLKASFDGKMIGGVAYRYEFGLFIIPRTVVEVFHFDGQTGLLSPMIRTPRVTIDYLPTYSLEFSPDSRLLYTCAVERMYNLQPCGLGGSRIMQFELCQPDSDAFFKNSRVIADIVVKCEPTITWGGMVLGADKRMHLPYSGDMVSTIEYPNRIGASCGFIFDSYRLSASNQHEPSTPQFDPTLMRKQVQNNIVHEGNCYPTPYRFYISNPRVSNLSWNFGDPASGNNTSSLPDPTHSFSAAGRYKVTVSFLDVDLGRTESLTDSIEVFNPANRILSGYPKDTSLCVAGSSGLMIRLQGINSTFRWFQNDENGLPLRSFFADSLRITETGKWYVEMKQDACQTCMLLDSINVRIIAKPGSLGPDQNLCTGDSLTLSTAADPDAVYTWSTGSMAPSIVVKTPGVYWLFADYPKEGCQARDTIQLFPGTKIDLAFPADTTLCAGETLLLGPPPGNAMLYWQDRSASYQYFVDKPGTYSAFAVSPQGCVSRDTVQVSYGIGVKPSLGLDSTLCVGDKLHLSAAGTAGTYTWSTGATTDAIDVTSTGTYWVQVNNGTCSSKDTISITFQAPPALSLGADTSLCSAEQLRLGTNVPGKNYLWQDGSTDATFLVKSAGTYWLQWSNGVCAARDTINIAYLQATPIDLGPNRQLCAWDSVQLDAGAGFTSYLWNSGETTRTIQIYAQGPHTVEAVNPNGCKSYGSMELMPSFALPYVDLGPSGTWCSSGSLQLDAGPDRASYAWSTGATSRYIPVTGPGKYSVTVTGDHGCRGTDSVNIRAIVDAPRDFLPSDTSICKYGTLTITATDAYASYLWSNGSTGMTTTFTAPGQYWLQVVDAQHCVGMDTITVTQRDCYIGVHVPNAFTPGHDGKNDLFRPIFAGTMLSYKFSVFNRFGEMVFSTNDPNASWDGTYRGKDQPTGTYIWKFSYLLSGLEPITDKGTVVLIR